MKVRCKFRVEHTKKNDDGSTDVHMRAVATGSEENAEYWRWTPAGTLVLSTVNQKAADALEPGVEYYVDIVRSDP
jgi:hypothetical protein